MSQILTKEEWFQKNWTLFLFGWLCLRAQPRDGPITAPSSSSFHQRCHTNSHPESTEFGLLCMKEKRKQHKACSLVQSSCSELKHFPVLKPREQRWPHEAERGPCMVTSGLSRALPRARGFHRHLPRLPPKHSHGLAVQILTGLECRCAGGWQGPQHSVLRGLRGVLALVSGSWHPARPRLCKIVVASVVQFLQHH